MCNIYVFLYAFVNTYIYAHIFCMCVCIFIFVCQTNSIIIITNKISTENNYIFKIAFVLALLYIGVES